MKPWKRWNKKLYGKSFFLYKIRKINEKFPWLIILFVIGMFFLLIIIWIINWKTAKEKTINLINLNNIKINKHNSIIREKEKEIYKKLDIIFAKISKNCSILQYSNINSQIWCNKKELEHYIESVFWKTANELWFKHNLENLNWIKKTVGEMNEKDFHFLPNWSKIKWDIVIHKYNSPKDLYYWIHVNDKPYETQNAIEHYINNKRLAVDIWVNRINRAVYVPDWKNKEISYKIKKVYSYDYWHWVELFFNVNWVEYKWLYWHVTLFDKYKDWDIVKTWDVLWKLNLTWISTWYHLHLELWQQDNQVLYSIEPAVLKDRKKHNFNLNKNKND